MSMPSRLGPLPDAFAFAGIATPTNEASGKCSVVQCMAFSVVHGAIVSTAHLLATSGVCPAAVAEEHMDRVLVSLSPEDCHTAYSALYIIGTQSVSCACSALCSNLWHLYSLCVCVCLWVLRMPGV